ncbi:MAG: DUF4465 domain-containing protein [Brumimicrobium sp.]|nr:DUF4465 domain-containing protein [Brumimicrobium sp.]
MKKFYYAASLILAFTTLRAQYTLCDFEDLLLPTVDTFYTGEDNAGQFMSKGAVFENTYEDFGSYYTWGGFAYSNKTDNSTPGYGNQYSAFAGIGANGSSQYAVYHAGDTLALPAVCAFRNVSIVNTTYAAVSMRDGDSFGKQFGSPYDANGNLDGTDGKDYFYITVYGWDINDNLVDSVEIYLADYRSNDPNDHYILDEWTDFSLAALNGSVYLTFSFTSSDVGTWGINTPLYFAMDNFEYKESGANLSTYEKSVKIYPNPADQLINITGIHGEITLIDAKGQVVEAITSSGMNTMDVSTLDAGVYFLKAYTSEGMISRKIVIQ